MHNLELFTAADLAAKQPGAPRFQVRAFTVTEAISTLFRAQIDAVHPSPSVDFDAIVGQPARLVVAIDSEGGPPRLWSGIVSHLELVRALPDDEGLCSYSVTLVPRLWLLTQRRNYRVFQFQSEVDIAVTLLEEWGIEHEVRLDRKSYKPRKYKVQYAETDYEFLYRVLADVGVSFFFEAGTGEASGELTLVLTDGPQKAAPLPEVLTYEDTPIMRSGKLFCTNLRKSQRVRPTRVTLRDRDYRRDAAFELQATATVDANAPLELFYYPENFNFVVDRDDAGSPSADDRGRARTDEREATRIAQIDLEARRNDAATVRFDANHMRLAPGSVVTLDAHPSPSVNAPFLVVEARLGGRFDGEMSLTVEAVDTKQSYRPTLAPKPRIIGLETATVVGPPGEEIHCDEFGRVRVHFHWDRMSKRNEASSCWMPVSQPWSGSGYGGSNLPRVGQEVLIEFLGGDPDRPIITGRVYTNLQKTPYKLPDNKTQSGWKSNSTGGGGGFNELMFEDKQGSELLRMQAERDKQVTVKRNSTTNVGAHRNVTVGGNRSVRVKKAETKDVTGDRTITVKGAQRTTVTGEVKITSTSDCIGLSSTVEIDAEAPVIFDNATTRIVLMVGSSQIIMSPTNIVIQADEVDINPGKGFAKYVMENGSMPKEPAPPEFVPSPGLPMHNPKDPADKKRAWDALDAAQKKRNDYLNKKNTYDREKAEYDKLITRLKSES
jgi:type VI secretion system secreted protein VgrG